MTSMVALSLIINLVAFSPGLVVGVETFFGPSEDFNYLMAALIGASVNAVMISGRIRAQVDEFVREKRI
jgi:hypothetical protein